MKKVYGIKRNTCGVYLIQNKQNKKCYVGSSVDIMGRLSTHFGRDSKRYLHHPLYEDIRKYGRDGFRWEVLEECSKNILLEREQHYFDLLKPEYNIIRPTECSFNDPLTKEHARQHLNTKENIEKRKVLYNTDEYKQLFSHIQDNRKKAIIMYKNGVLVCEFESFSECQRWLNVHTNFKGKNKISKIKAVCDGERPTAYGYTFKYKNL